MENLERAKELLSHKFPKASDADVLAYALELLVGKMDPLKQARTASATRSATERQVLQKAGGRCEYRDPRSGKRCGSRYQVEVDHIKPKALGGGDSPDNLRALCKQHNLFMAEKVLGKKRIAPYWKNRI
jgi:hypothetical protein